jgi:hypothetical protein
MITWAIAALAIVVTREYYFFLYQNFETAQTNYLGKCNEVSIAVAENE